MTSTISKDGFAYTIASNRHKPVILLLHGFLGCRADWTEIATGLSDDFCPLTVDLPGHGQTRVALDQYDFPATARLLTRLLDELRIGRCHALGYSMGGRLALYLTIKHPDRIDCGVIESASPGLKTAAERLTRQQQDQQSAQKLLTDFDRFLADWYAQPLFQSLAKQPAMLAELIARRRLNQPCLLAQSLQKAGTGAQDSLWPELVGLKNPVLLLAGEYDVKYQQIMQAMRQVQPALFMQIIPNAGHNIHLEQPMLYLESVRRFFMGSGDFGANK